MKGLSVLSILALTIFIFSFTGCDGSDDFESSVKLRDVNFGVVSRVDDQENPHVVYSYEEDEFFVVWQDDRSGEYSIVGSRVHSYSGNPLGDEVFVSEDTAEIDHNSDYTIPADSPYTVTLTGFHSSGELKTGTVSVSENGTDYSQVTTPSTSGQYSVNMYTGTFTFHSSDAGKTVSISATEEYDLLTEQKNPAVAYSPDDTLYLVVWQDDRGTSSAIYGQFVESSDGSLDGENFKLATTTEAQANPRIVYNTTDNVFFVVFERGENADADVVGLTVQGDGTIGNLVDIETNSAKQRNIAIAYNPDNNNYLLVWEDFRNSSTISDLWGVVCASNGTPGTPFAVSTLQENQKNPSLAFTLGAGKTSYLLVWEDYSLGDAEIFGQVLDETGSSTGAYVNITNSDWRQTEPVAHYDDYRDKFMVLWRDDYNTSDDVFAQIVSSDGRVINEFRVVSRDSYYADEKLPVLAYNTRENEYMFVFSTDEYGDWDIYGQFGK